MANNVDQLQIEIGASSESAVKSIKNLAAAMSELKQVLSGGNKSYSSTIKGLRELSDAAQSLSGLSASLNGLRGLGAALNNLSTVKVSRTIGTNLRSIVLVANGINGGTIQRLNDMAAALSGFPRSVANLRQTGAGSTAAAAAGPVDSGTTQVGVEKVRVETDEAENKVNRLSEIVTRLKANLDSLGQGGSDRLKAMFSAAIAPARKFAAAVQNVASSFKRILFYRLIRTMIKQIGDAFRTGIANAYQYSKAMDGVFAASMDRAATAALYFKNSLGAAMMPLVNMIVPVLDKIIDKIVELINAFNQLMARLSGASTWTKALRYPKQYGEEAKKAGGALKKAKDYMLSFDELNVFNDNASSGGGGAAAVEDYTKMFETVKLDDQFSGMLKPLQKIIETTQKWAKSLNFEPIKKSLSGLKTSFEGLAKVVGDALFWAYTNVLLPLASWVIEDAAPAVIDALAAAFDFLSSVLTAIQPYAQWVWDNFLQPLAAWTGDAIITVLGNVTSLFEKLTAVLNGDVSFTEFIGSLNTIETVLLGIGTALAAIAIAKGVISAVSTGVSLLKTAFSALTSPIGLVTLAIAALVVGIVELIKHWDAVKGAAVAAWEAVSNAFSTAATWFYDNVVAPVVGFFTGLWENLTGGATEAWEGIKGVFATVGQWFSDTFSEAWEGIVSVFSVAGEIFEDIKNGVVTAFVFIVNQIITGINKVIALPFQGINAVLQAIHDVNILGVKPFTWIGTIAIPEIPLLTLAEGGFVDSGQMFIAREAGPELVGTIGNQTAVANNADIIAGVSQGVAGANEPVVAALNILIAAVQNIDPTVVIGDGDIGRAYDRYKADRGVAVNAGTFANAY